MHEPQDPSQDKWGADIHPAFGSITAYRITATPGAVLFDSDIRHGQYVRVMVTGMSRKRDLHRDWLHSDSKPLIEVDMSEAQWASFVSSMNTSGVPCTIRATETNRDVPGLHYESRLQESLDEVRGAADEAFREIREAMAAHDALDPKASAKERREALNWVRTKIGHAAGSVEFAGKSLHEHAENVVQKSRADIEAMVQSKAQQLGLSQADMLALDAATDSSAL